MTNSTMLAEAEKVYQVLIKGRIIEREAAQRRLTEGDATIDRERLRRLIIEGLDGSFSVSNASKDSKSTKAWARCWLLSALGRTLDDDKRAAEYVRRYTSVDHEPNYWARYWALESLVVARAADLSSLARRARLGDAAGVARRPARGRRPSHLRDRRVPQFLGRHVRLDRRA